MSTPVTNVLERDSGQLDPLVVARDVDVREGESWLLLARGPSVEVWALRAPLIGYRGFIISRDVANERTCRRLDANGRELEVIIGRIPRHRVSAPRCVHCGEPIYDNGTVYVHIRVSGNLAIHDQWCTSRRFSFAETAEMFELRTQTHIRPLSSYGDHRIDEAAAALDRVLDNNSEGNR